MALRVLLADESTTIKKVMQLALQDFAVEVKSVQSGIDVVEVAKAFHPDIIFADVLLQKKNGYEVCAEIKRHAEFSGIPVVLMWSSFMDLDEQQAKSSQADRRLEKPFDVENLRQIVLDLVPKTNSQRLAHFLKFPESVTEPLAAEQKAAQANQAKAAVAPPLVAPAAKPATAKPATAKPAPSVATPAQQPVAQPKAETWSMESFDDIGQFAEEPADPMPSASFELEEAPIELELDEEHATQVMSKENLLSIDFESSREENASSPMAADSSDDAFQEIQISSQTKTTRMDLVSREQDTAVQVGLKGGVESDENFDVEPNDRNSGNDDNDEAWSHQNLAKFKLDADAVESEEIKLDIEPERLELETFGHDGDDPAKLSLHLETVQEQAYSQPEDFNGRPAKTRERVEVAQNPKAQKLDADQLESVIRAQSREIIETVVRKMVRDIVPDLATQLIRDELDRLLAESPKESTP